MNKEIEKKISVLDDLMHWGTITLVNRVKLNYFNREVFRIDAHVQEEGKIETKSNINISSLVPKNIIGYTLHYLDPRPKKISLETALNHIQNGITNIDYGSKHYNVSKGG